MLPLRQVFTARLLSEDERIPLLKVLSLFLAGREWGVVALGRSLVDGDTVAFCPAFEKSLEDKLFHNVRFVLFAYFHLLLGIVKLQLFRVVVSAKSFIILRLYLRKLIFLFEKLRFRHSLLLLLF